MVPVVADSGSSVEGVASATERVCRDPEISMAMGSWASSFTMASTEVTERLGIPQFTISFADSLHQRGFKYGFYVSPPYATLSGVGVQVIDVAKKQERRSRRQ
jgi:branched-chain amino acid transport system substrate-binding protein